MFSKLFGRKPPVQPPEPPSSPYEVALARGRSEIQWHTQFLQETFGLGTGGSWGVDLETGVITFDNPGGIRLTAPVQVIGTLDTAKGTWMWGWDHPSVREGIDVHAKTVRAFGLEHGVERLTTRIVEATEADAWDFTALAVHLNKAQGGYCGPSGSTRVMMTFGKVTAVKAG